VSVRCGWNHCICIVENGSCYGFGEIKHSQLPISSQENRADTDSSNNRSYYKSPILLECFEHLPIGLVACGRGHSVFVSGRVNLNHIPGTWYISKKSRQYFSDVDIVLS
jgi:alpha-tubulin suppressor-like RCC1 family protein